MKEKKKILTLTSVQKAVAISIPKRYCTKQIIKEQLLWNVLSNKQVFVSVLFIGFLLPFFSCQSKLSEKELKTYIQNPENRLTQTKQVNNVEYIVTYKPTALMIAQELRNNQEKLNLEQLKNKYSQFHYFMLSVMVNNRDILSNKTQSVNEFGQAVYELSFNMNDNAFLTNDQNDTLNLIDYAFPRMYGMMPKTNMLFVFEKGNWETTSSIKLHLKEFGLNTGDTKYNFSAKDINKIPELKL